MTAVNDLNFPNLDTTGMFSRENLLHPVLQHGKNCIAHDAIGTMQGFVIYFEWNCIWKLQFLTGR